MANFLFVWSVRNNVLLYNHKKEFMSVQELCILTDYIKWKFKSIQFISKVQTFQKMHLITYNVFSFDCKLSPNLCINMQYDPS